MQPKMKKPVGFILIFSFCILLLFLIMQPLEIYLLGGDIATLFPAGKIALQQRNLHLLIQILMLLVVIPVYVLTFIFSWKYRADNKKATYDPNFDDSRLAEYIWWGLPFILIIIIGSITWIRTHELDPFKPLSSEKKPLHIQVVALQWKWLFLYPEEKIASVNLLSFPQNRDLNFELTSDAPMNSFWIPKLGGQIYAMPKMRTKLHLIANELGEFRGSSANLSGEGFAEMTFLAKSITDEEFEKWVLEAQNSSPTLTPEEYATLAEPSKAHPPTLYKLEDTTLFDQIIMKYREPHE